MPPTGRHPCRCGHTEHGNDAPAAAWRPPIAGAEVVALSRQAHTHRGGWIESSLDHALALTPNSGTTKAGALPSRRVLIRADHRYYDPLGLPLRAARLRTRLIRAAFVRHRLRRRVSPVPHQTLSTCRPPYPGEIRRTFSSGLSRDRRGLRRDMPGSALSL
jgi:hypothetical protein